MEEVATPDNGGWWSRLVGRLGGGPGWLEIDGYYADDIRSERPLRVTRRARVTGDVYAPCVVVAGAVHGNVIAGDLAVLATGEVWGDIYAGRLSQEVGSVVRGWLYSLEDSGWRAMLTAGQPSSNGDRPGAERLALHRLREEALAARLARVELEETLAARLQDAVGEELASARQLETELAALQATLRESENEQAALAHTLIQRDATLAQREAAVADLERKLGEVEGQLRQVTTDFAAQQEVREVLEKRQGQLDVDLKAERVRADVMAARVNNLESALQASLQRTAEQQEALVRWQELAEVSEIRIQELEDEVSAAAIKLDEESKVAQLMREKKEKAEAALHKSRNEVNEMRQRLLSATPQTKAAKAALATARQRIADLEGQLDAATAEAQREEATVAALRHSLEAAEAQQLLEAQKAAQQSSRVKQLEELLAAAEEKAGTWQENVGRMTALLYDAEERLKKQRSRHKMLESELEETRARHADSARQRALQLEAMEGEIAHYEREFSAQRERLSEVQATLVEKELALQQLRDDGLRQAAELRKVRQMATERIRRLENDLTRARRENEALRATSR